MAVRKSPKQTTLYNPRKQQKREAFSFNKLNAFAAGSSAQRVAMETLKSQRYVFTPEQIRTALDTQDAPTLRKMSNYFFYNSGAYRRLVEYLGGILTNDFLVVPNVKVEDAENKSFLRGLENISNYVRSSNIKETCSTIAKAVVKDGAFFGYEREIDKIFTLQQLPGEFCRSRFKIDNMYAVEFNFAYFDSFRGDEKVEMLNAFPAEFAAMHDTYLGDRSETWQLLDPQFARAHMLQSQIPVLSPVFVDLLELEDYKKIEKARSSLDIYKLLIQKIPVNKDGEIELYMEEIEELHNNARGMVTNSNVDVITTPCDFTDVNLTDRSSQAKDDVRKATDTVYSTAGTSTVLFTDGARSTSTGLALSVKVDEALMFPLLNQFEAWYAHKFRNLVKGKFSFTISFPPISHYNRKEMLTLYTSAATLGFPTKLLTMAAIGINQFDVDFLLTYENEVLRLQDRMIPTASAYNQGATVAEEGQQGGRPESEEPLTDEGEATKDGDKNE